jgi:hypothetical protein
MTMIVEFREGKVSRSGIYLDHAEALRAGGLTEPRCRVAFRRMVAVPITSVRYESGRY